MSGMPTQGEIKHNFQSVKTEVDSLIKAAEQVQKYVISDMKKKVVVLVRDATSTVYNIQKSEVARANYKTSSSLSDHRKTNVSVTGRTITSLTVHFKGRKRADWKTTARPKPHPAKSSKVFSNKKKYTVFQEVFRGQKTPIVGRNGNRVFIAQIGGKLVPMVVTKANNKPLIKGSSSVPDAIMNERTRAIWQPALNAALEERLIHHTKRYMAGDVYPEFSI